MKTYQKIFLLIVIFIFFFIGKTLFDVGFFTKIEPHFDGKITEIDGFLGSEDITIDQSTGLAFISSNDFRDKSTEGSILMLNLNQKKPIPVNLTLNIHLPDFHPHGISLYQNIDGTKQLFVINHSKTGNYIEIFNIKDTTLVHETSISDPLFVSPNDLVAVGKRSFYFTNDHNEKLSSWRAKKDLLQIAMGNVCYFDGKKAKIMAEGFLYANGINISNNGKKLFVASTSGKKIKVFDREISSGQLTESDEIAIKGADNIEIDKEDNLWVGCHPKLLAFLNHSKNQAELSPSKINKVTYSNKGDYKIESIYLNNGKPVSGSSVGAVFGKKLLIGTVFEDKVLIGEMEK